MFQPCLNEGCQLDDMKDIFKMWVPKEVNNVHIETFQVLEINLRFPG